MSAKEIAQQWFAIREALEHSSSIMEYFLWMLKWKHLKKLMDNNPKLRLLATREYRLLEIERAKKQIEEAEQAIKEIDRDIAEIDKQNASVAELG